MAGLIRQSDIEEVKSRVNLADIIGDHVTLKSAGPGSMKGLCPFHDERSPSFHVRPALGYYHCFGCGESGDAITFLQRMDHVTFTEAVERLAGSVGYQLHYEEGSGKSDGINRPRLLAANKAAAEFFVAQLGSPEAAVGRAFLGERGFDAAAAAHFGVGFAPKSWDALLNHLKSLGYTQEEIVTAGLVSQGDRGPYDRFRGRLVWPIRDTSGQVLGFGARRLLDDDKGPKYLNTPETPVYHKSQVLYGLDLAKRAISKDRQVVVVEGYTDVMACHMAGITSAVATCGTAFGTEHIKVLRRIMNDDSGIGSVIFTFDPDAAGEKAAMRAFSDEKKFTAQSFVAVAPDGLDPCDLRLAHGNEAVAAMIAAKKPLFEFALRQRISQFNLDTVEGRVGALNAAAPIVADIRDNSLRPRYVRELARMLGEELGDVEQAVRDAQRKSSAVATHPQPARGGARPHQSIAPRNDGQQRSEQPYGRSDGGQPPRPQSGAAGAGGPASADAAVQAPPIDTSYGGPTSGHAIDDADPYAGGDFTQSIPEPRTGIADLPGDPVTRLERDAVMAMLQQPLTIETEVFNQGIRAQLSNGALTVVRNAIAAQLPAEATSAWLGRVIEDTPEPFKDLVRELAIAPIPERSEAGMVRYVNDIVISLVERDMLAFKAELVGQLQRLGDNAGEPYQRVQRQLMELETARRKLRTTSA
ncbi:DNA primase [Lysinibacter cavernae]|uniref:DNA primase n=1 Tax=Lysinibacter cavernae TaxID=1640652 RepID=A0A7X5TTU9_9MICO|nr:DNA primase [Lysinibacter cavernae]NIH52987.1 DNA primase [Lysinibacter cavernae]